MVKQDMLNATELNYVAGNGNLENHSSNCTPTSAG
jgi:hypothetical protein